VINPAPWYGVDGYDDCDPGYYIVDANNHIVIADTEGTLTKETRDLIVRLRNDADE
jgi:phosphatidate phosphatase PAH1